MPGCADRLFGRSRWPRKQYARHTDPPRRVAAGAPLQPVGRRWEPGQGCRHHACRGGRPGCSGVLDGRGGSTHGIQVLPGGLRQGLRCNRSASAGSRPKAAGIMPAGAGDPAVRAFSMAEEAVHMAHKSSPAGCGRGSVATGRQALGAGPGLPASCLQGRATRLFGRSRWPRRQYTWHTSPPPAGCGRGSVATGRQALGAGPGLGRASPGALLVEANEVHQGREPVPGPAHRGRRGLRWAPHILERLVATARPG